MTNQNIIKNRLYDTVYLMDQQLDEMETLVRHAHTTALTQTIVDEMDSIINNLRLSQREFNTLTNQI